MSLDAMGTSWQGRLLAVISGMLISGTALAQKPKLRASLEHCPIRFRQQPSVTSLVFSPDGKVLASASSHWTVKLWNVQRGNIMATLSGHAAGVAFLAFSPDGETLALCFSMQYAMTVWILKTGKEIADLDDHNGTVFSLAYSSDGKTLASASRDGTIKLYDIPVGKKAGR